MDKDLFTGELVRLAAIDPQQSAEAFARWSREFRILAIVGQ